MEDLWAFNEEMVARAVFDCETPVISAVGHETDTTIIDYVADLRAPTPSAAAELAVYDYYQMEYRINEYQQRLLRQIKVKTQMARLKLREYQTKLRYLHPENQLRENRQRLVDYEDKLRFYMEQAIKDARVQWNIYVERMKSLSPLHKLSQGFSYVEGDSGRAVTSITQVQEGAVLAIHVTDGVIHAKVEDVRKEQHG